MSKELSPLNRDLGLALSSKEVKLVEAWLSKVLAENATKPPLDESGRVDQGALTYKAGQISVINKIREMRVQLEGFMHGSE